MDLHKVLEFLDTVFGAADLIIAGLILLFALIPGEQPESALKKAAEFVSKFSRKSKTE